MASKRLRFYTALTLASLLICSPVSAGIDFRASSIIEVAESEVADLSDGQTYYARLYWCIGVIVPGKYLIHIFPIDHIHQRMNKLNYLITLFYCIPKDAEVIIVTSEKRDKIYPELISYEDVLRVLRLKTDNITKYDDIEEYKLVIANKDKWEVRPRKKGDMKDIGSSVYIGSTPIGVNYEN